MDEARGQRLRAIRGDLKLTQKEMADALGMSLSGWQAIENGHNPPSGETLMKIAAHGYSPTWILLDVGAKRLLAADTAVELVRMAGQAVTDVYREEDVRIPASVLSAEIARFYAGLLADGRDGDDALKRVEAQADRLRHELRGAAAAPGTGKREAS